MEQIKAWQVAQQLRDYIKAVRGAGYYAQPAITGGRDPEAWCDWAMDQASRLDPLSPVRHRCWTTRSSSSGIDDFPVNSLLLIS
jgi:hypothetical protein